MVFQVRSSAALLLLFMFGFSCILGQDLRETDALCNPDGCFVVYFQRRIFLDSWRACKEKGGNLATIKRKEDADAIAALFSAVDLPHSQTKVQVWIGLQRQPRHCTTKHPLRGFSWTTGDQDTQYTNWRGEDSLRMCSVPRCVAMSYSTQEQSDNFMWLDGACSVPVDGYLCHYAYKGMCPALWSEGAGNALYTTPFNLLSTILTYIPFGSVATVPCPTGAMQEQSVLCMLRDDGTVGWSREPPLCSDHSVAHNLCDRDNGGCDHYCRSAGGHVFCECADGYHLGDDGQTCELTDVCHGAPCQFECLRFPDSYRCACPEGYMLAPDESTCLDVDECLQSPCEQLCENFPGTFECRCREGYFPDDAGGCEAVDECMDNPCEHACENTPGSHICHCHLGFSPVPEEPSQCQDIDECQIPGTCEQMCVNYDGGFECYCKEGYELMSDQSSCQEIAATVTHKPEPDWDPLKYNWNQEQSHVSWPKENEQRPEWLTDPPRVSVSDVIWVTTAPQDELYFDPELDLQTQRDDRGAKQRDWSSDPEIHVLSTTTYDKLLPTTTSSSTTPIWYEEDEETTSAPPLLPTSTTSEGAWYWWPLTSTRSPENPEDSTTDYNTSTASGQQKEPEDEETLRGENTQVPVEESGNVETTRSQGPAAPTNFTTPQPPLGEGGRSGDGLDSVQDDREQTRGSTWLLVGLLVPICIFIVVMVALGIVYCTRCAVQPKNKKTTECYHWISGAHDKQAPPNAAAGVKSHV